MRRIRMDAESGEKKSQQTVSRRKTYDIDFYVRNNASAPAVGIVHSRKTEVGAVCCNFSLRLRLSLQKEIFFPIPRNRRLYVRIRSVRSYELHDIFLSPVVVFL